MKLMVLLKEEEERLNFMPVGSIYILETRKYFGAFFAGSHPTFFLPLDLNLMVIFFGAALLFLGFVHLELLS